MGSSKYSEKTTKTESLPTIGEKTKVFILYNYISKLCKIGTLRIQLLHILLPVSYKKSRNVKIRQKI